MLSLWMVRNVRKGLLVSVRREKQQDSVCFKISFLFFFDVDMNDDTERAVTGNENLITGLTTNSDTLPCDYATSPVSTRQTRRRGPRHGLGDLTMVDTNVGRALRYLV